MSTIHTVYARNDSGSEIGYQIDHGSGRDILLVTNWISNIEVMREQPLVGRSLKRLGQAGRLVVFDKLGSGVSDPLPTDNPELGPSSEQGAADMLCVLDAVGIERACVVSTDFGGWPALVFAATYPERVESLILSDTTARLLSGENYPIGLAPEEFPGVIDLIDGAYGSGGFLILAPTLYEDEQLRTWAARYERMACPRATMLSFWRSAAELDLRSVLPMVRCPVLVIHHENNPFIPIEHGRYLAEHLKDSEFLALDGAESLFFADDRVFDAAIRWTGGIAPTDDSDRCLASILFTDVVGSTETAARLGDLKWREVLDTHDSIASRVVGQHRGRLIKNTGDGVMATFDGPARAVRCGVELMENLRGAGIDIRCGIHTGEIEVRGDDIGGIAVHIAARVMSVGGSEYVTVSRTVKDLTAGSGVHYTSLGDHSLKGVPESWELFSVTAS